MGSTLDHFVIDRRLMHAVMYVRRLDNFGIHPHSPVRMATMAEPRKLMIRTLVAPKKIPAHLPAGCLTEAQAEQKEWGGGGGAAVEGLGRVRGRSSGGHPWKGREG